MSLHWILMLTVTLLHCLTAFPISTTTVVNVTYEDIKQLIEDLEPMGCKQTDSVFYSPSGSNNCAISALKCSIQELATYEHECNVNVNLVNRLKESIEMVIQKHNSTDCTCEGSEQKPYQGFLNNTLTLLQMLNSNRV